LKRFQFKHPESNTPGIYGDETMTTNTESPCFISGRLPLFAWQDSGVYTNKIRYNFMK